MRGKGAVGHCSDSEASEGIDTYAEEGDLDLGVRDSAEDGAHFLEFLHRCQEFSFKICWASGRM